MFCIYVGGTSYDRTSSAICQYFMLNFYALTELIMKERQVKMMSEFEKAVRHALIDRDMTMTDLANELGISVSYVSDLLKKKRENQEQLQRIKDFLGITDTDDYEE